MKMKHTLALLIVALFAYNVSRAQFGDALASRNLLNEEFDGETLPESLYYSPENDFSVSDGHLVFQTSASVTGTYSYYRPDFVVEDFTMEFVVTKEDGSLNATMGAWFRSNADINDSQTKIGYRVIIDNEGYYHVLKYYEGNIYEWIQGWTQSENLNTGFGNSNKIKIVATGSNFKIYFNDQFEFSFDDETYPSGYVNAVAYNYSYETVKWDYFTMEYEELEELLAPVNLTIDESNASLGIAVANWEAADGSEPNSFNLYLDNTTTVIANVSDLTYTLTDLEAGEHFAGVSAVYESGESEIVTATFNITIGVNNLDAQNIVLYPNPAVNLLTIDCEAGSELTVYSCSGQVVIREITSNELHTVNISELQGGNYYVVLKNNKGVSRHKVVVIK